MIIDEVLFVGIRKLNSSGIEDSALKARIIMSKVLDVSKEYILIHGNEEFPIEKLDEFTEKINRLCNHEPIQYITNSQDFFGLNFYVDENVLIPQPDTEILVEETIKIIRKYHRKLKVLDLCTGSSAIAICLSKEENTEVTASDISKEALEVARKNSVLNNSNINLVESNLFENIDGEFDIIVSNPPYIESETIKNLPKEVQKEPEIALDGGEDGLKFYRKIAEESIKHLCTEGYLIVEIGYNQKDSVIKIFNENKFKNIICIKDYAQNDRLIIANRG